MSRRFIEETALSKLSFPLFIYIIEFVSIFSEIKFLLSATRVTPTGFQTLE
jgi:hypothetical protein